MGKELTALNEIGVQRRKVAPLCGCMQDISFTLARFSNERLSVIHDKKQTVQVSSANVTPITEPLRHIKKLLRLSDMEPKGRQRGCRDFPDYVTFFRTSDQLDVTAAVRLPLSMEGDLKLCE
jgi:hypothetical protein